MNTILFIDIVESSKLWKQYPKRMKKALEKHIKLVTDITKQYKGKIIKTIGDAYMILFTGKHSLQRAIVFSIELQHIHRDPNLGLMIYVDTQNKKPNKKHKPNKNLKIRIGMAYGEMHLVKSIVQGCKLDEYIGTTVNIASRMESKISEEGGFAFYSQIKVPISIIKMLNNIGYIETIVVSNKCLLTKNSLKRSGRLINPKCINPKYLKGVGDLVAYKVSL